MSEAALQLVYDGDAVRHGEMDVADLAPALLGMGQMLKAAGRVAYGNEAEVSVRVRTMRDGSFAVDLSLAIEGGKAAWEFWKQDDVQAAVQLASFMGFTVGGGVFALVKALKGRRIKRGQASQPDLVAIETPDGLIEVPEVVARLALDPSVRAAIEKVVVEPLEKEGIDTVLIAGPSGGQKVERDEADWFRAPSESEDDEFVSRYRRAFSIVSLHFTEGKKWRLSDGRGPAKLIVIEDQNFNDRVARNEERFAKGDVLICDVIETSRRTASGFKSEYQIKAVVEHRPAPVLPQLPLGDDRLLPPSKG